MPDEPTTIEPVAAVEPVVEPVVTEPVAAAPDPGVSRADFERLERMLTSMASLVTQQQQPAVQAAPQQPVAAVTEDQLWAAATQGNRAAFDEYTRRIALKETAGVQGAAQRHQAVMSQLGVLYQKYPELSDAQNPLTQKALAFRQALLQMGEPNSRETELNAILRAVADSRELIQQPATQPRTPTNVSQFPATPRQTGTVRDVTEVVTPDEHRLAKQFGVKDPSVAKKKFWERNGKGTSSVSPNIAAALSLQDKGNHA